MDFVKIHPFVESNGKTACLLMNFELMRNGFLPVVIQVKYRLAYYEALDTAHRNNDYSYFISMVANEEAAVLKMYLSVIAG